MKKELAVAALRNGTVIDHIPANALFKVTRILGVEELDTPVTIGNNLPSHRLGAKGIIKVDGREYPEDILDRIAIVAPGAQVNVIRDYEVVSKRRVTLPETIVGLVRCPNSKCITNNEPMKTRFLVSAVATGMLRCAYCNREVQGAHATLL